MSGYGQFALGYLERGWSPLPLPHGAKWPPPKGTTGYDAPAIERDVVEAWAAQQPDANIALRMPERVVGIDVDAYKPNAVATMRRLEALAPMPSTWRSSSRGTAGDVPYESGIYFFRIPDDVPAEVIRDLRDPRGVDGTTKNADVELLRPFHRYAVAAPSLSPPPPKGSGETYVWYAPDGSNMPPYVAQLPELPREWLAELTPRAAASGTAPVSAAPMSDQAASAWENAAVRGCVDRLRAMSVAATPGGVGYVGEPWDETTFYVACRLLEIANNPATTLAPEHVEILLLEHAPRDANFDDAAVLAKMASARSRIGDRAAELPAARADDSGLFKRAQPSSAVGQPGGRVIAHDDVVEVANVNVATRWLRSEIGTGRLAGMFLRKGELVYTPRIGEDGYIEKKNVIAEGSASISLVDHLQLQARIQNRYTVVKTVEKRGETKGETVMETSPGMFPVAACSVIAKAPDDCPNLRDLRGVIHSPSFRADGTVITQPGFDDATGLLFLPIGHQPAAIPETPTLEHVRLAKSWIEYMLQDYVFESDDDRATYIGLMMTPLLRTLTPPPYKLGVVQAHDPGSGKSFLARAITSIHGGAFIPEMSSDDVELAKVVGAVLDTQTAPVVLFDNVSGYVKSSVLAGLLTSPTFGSRRLGSSTTIEADNDRLWLLTSNNAQLGGDLGRRNVRVRLNPNVPNPHLRTGFAIARFEDWVREHRGELLWSLLTLVRHWVCQGMPFPDTVTEDSYGNWVATVRGVLASAGIPGTFDSLDAQEEQLDQEADEWATFLRAVHEHMADRPWTVKALLTLVAHPATTGDPARPIPFDALPGDLSRNRTVLEPSSLATSLSRWLTNRRGRWYEGLTVDIHGAKTKEGRLWRTREYAPRG